MAEKCTPTPPYSWSGFAILLLAAGTNGASRKPGKLQLRGLISRIVISRHQLPTLLPQPLPLRFRHQPIIRPQETTQRNATPTSTKYCQPREGRKNGKRIGQSEFPLRFGRDADIHRGIIVGQDLVIASYVTLGRYDVYSWGRCFASPSRLSTWCRGIEHPKCSGDCLAPNGISPHAAGKGIERVPA